MKRLITGLICSILLLTTVFMAGCGRNQSDGQSQTSGNAQASENAQITLNVMTWDGSDNLVKQIFDKTISSFKASHNNATINLQNVDYNDYFTKLQTQLAAGSPPDVYELGESDINKYWNKGLLIDLTPYTTGKNKMDMSDFYPNVLQVVEQEGKLPGIPVGPATYAIYYNKKMFDEAQVQYPASGWTWDDFRDTAIKLTKTENGKPVQWGALLPTSSDQIEPLLVSNGGSILSSDGKAAVGYLDSAKSVEALKWYSELALMVSPSTDQQKAFGSGVDLFNTGKVAMNFTGPWPMTTYQNNKDLDFGVIELPKWKGADTNDIMYCAAYGISNKSKYPQAGWDFIKEFCDPSTESGKMLAKHGLPATKTLAADPVYNDAVFQPFINELNTGIIKSAYFLNPYFRSAQSQYLNPALQTLCSQKGVDVQAKMTEVAKQMDMYFKQQGN